MKISKMANENNVPEWAIEGSSLAKSEHNEKLLQNTVDRINAKEANDVNEIDIVEECSYIEKCASSNKTYFYNNKWSDSHLSHLREYASVCGTKTIGVDPTSLVEQQVQASSEQIVKTASTESTLKSDLSEMIGDPFNIDKHSDMSHMEQANWEKVEGQSTMADFSTTAAMKGAILPLRGGEDYNVSNQEYVAKNQNSIHDYKAIENLSNSEVEDTGTRLRRERTEREAAIAQGHKDWEQSHIDAMASDVNIPTGVVFPTEVMNAQPGLSNPSGNMGVYGKFDPDSIPEKTAGESIRSNNEERKASIQRGAEEDRSWDEIKASPSRMVSNTFSDELKKYLK